MTILEKLEWAYHTLKDQLKFGLPEEQAIIAREKRVRGVLKDVIDELKTERSKLEDGQVIVNYEWEPEDSQEALNKLINEEGWDD